LQHNIFEGLDLWVVLYAAGMALLASLLTRTRERQAQQRRGLPLTPWPTTLPDTGTGTLVGTMLALTIPGFWPVLHNFTGISLLTAFGGIAGPRLWDMVSSDSGIKSILVALAQAATGPLGKFISAQQPKKDGDSDGNQSPPHV